MKYHLGMTHHKMRSFFITCLIIILNLPHKTICCPATCTCTSTDEEEETVKTSKDKTVVNLAEVTTTFIPIVSKTIIADCWIHSNLVEIPCEPTWTILHLKILSDVQSNENKSTVIQPGEVTLSSSLFRQCTSLTRLAIWEQSQFTSLPNNFLLPITNLTTLLIEVPSLTKLPDHFLAFLPHVEFISISKSRQLREFDRLVFEPCPQSLRTIWLNGNRLGDRLPPGLFRHCTNLKTLSLNQNRLRVLDWASFHGLSGLKYLRLRGNQFTGDLVEVMGYRDGHSSALHAIPVLKILDMAENNLTSIADERWSGTCDLNLHQNIGLCVLEELNLANNNLQWLGPNTFRYLPRLTTLKLDGNALLYMPESVGALSVALYAIAFGQARMSHLIISTMKIKDKLNVCKLEKNKNNTGVASVHEGQFPRVLWEVLLNLNQTVCNQPYEIQSSNPIEKTINSNGSVYPSFISCSSEDPPNWRFVRHLTNTQIVISAAVIFFLGVAVTFILYLCLVCSEKCVNQMNFETSKSDRIPKVASASTNQTKLTLMHPPPPIGRNLSLSNHATSVQYLSQPGSLNSNNQLRQIMIAHPDRNCVLFDPATRRVNSVANVFQRRIDPPQGHPVIVNANHAMMVPHFQLNGNLRQSHLGNPQVPVHRSVHTVASNTPNEFTSMIRASKIDHPRGGSLYSHIADTTHEGSAYSLGMVTPKPTRKLT